jgi:hypothetical protein
LRNSDHAFDATDHAADHTAHHAANDGADRTGGALAHGDALLAPTHNTLGLGRERHRKRGRNNDGNCKLSLHEQTPLLMFAVSTDRRGRFSLGIMAPARGECGRESAKSQRSLDGAKQIRQASA